ncbi:MAG TPA: DUF5054 domain-containing protein, partial [Iamia sp.]|nr:DUF5054 domain-containing protein [Iamia sp.]
MSEHSERTSPGPDVRTVHLVAKTHLDIGFTALAATVVDTYVDSYIPAALALAAELRARGGPERFVWTTGSWLVHTFLERTDAAGRRAAEEAIATGDLAWHALPFTTHTELADVGLIEAGLEISARLDHRFGRRTIAAKLTDVPGHTRGLVPLLASAGVELLHIGVNPVATVPDVPPVFRWRSPDGAEVTVVYQEGGYGDLSVVPGCADALAFAHTGDNLGPPAADDVVASFAALRSRVPGAEVRGSTLDAFALGLRPVAADLPVVTAEIGDTWIHGVGTDPQKVARFRELLRLRRAWAAEGMVAPDDSRLRGFHEHLLLVAEHTWGLDEKTHLPDRERWGRSTLAELRAEPRTRAYEASWAEQREHIDAAVASIESDGLRQAAEATLRALDDPVPPRLPGAPVPPGQRVRLGDWEIGVDPATGAIDHLVDAISGQVLADAEHPLAVLAHETFSEADYQRRWDTYVHSRPEDEWWAVEDNLKPGIDAAGAVSAWWEPASAAVHIGERLSQRVGASPGTEAGARRAPEPSDEGDEASEELPTVDALVVEIRLPDEASTCSGAPPLAVLHLTDTSPPMGPSRLGVELRWDDKPANRLPEATWLGFRPFVADADADADLMVLDKLGQDVSPLDVVPGGNRQLHAVGEGVRWPGPGGTVALRTLDAPLVAPGRPHLLDF